MTFKVTVSPANVAFDVNRDEAILAAAIRAGIGLPYGCRDGACGSCKCRLLEGRVIHGAHQLKALSVEEEAQGMILACCAAPQTDCVVQARTSVISGEYAPQKMPVRVASLEVPTADMVMRTTISVGVACYPADYPGTIQGLLEKADKALYGAKQAGRDRVMLSGERKPEPARRRR